MRSHAVTIWTALVLGFLFAAAAPADSARWFALSRHGECADLTAALRHKLSDFPVVRTAEEVVQALQARGIKAERLALPDAPDGFTQVKVPALGWELILARQDRCAGFAAAPK